MLDASATSGPESLLYVGELLHRVKNEYAIAIASASMMASRSSCQETKGALEQVIECLTRFAKPIACFLRPHSTGSPILATI